MMARRGVLGLLAGAATFVLSGCGFFGGNSYRFKMTVEVDTPQGMKSGSSVYAVMGTSTTDLATGGSSSFTDVRGEALMVDLPDGKMLFALLRRANATGGNDNLAQLSMRALDPAYNGAAIESAKRIASSDGITSPGAARAEDNPLLVTFADINDPTSVTRVDPADLAASLGAGFRLKRIMVEVTDEDVTVGIQKKFPWWEKLKNRHLDGTSTVATDLTAQNIAARLSLDSFTTEVGK
jgi:hypothetical protein